MINQEFCQLNVLGTQLALPSAIRSINSLRVISATSFNLGPFSLTPERKANYSFSSSFLMYRPHPFSTSGTANRSACFAKQFY